MLDFMLYLKTIVMYMHVCRCVGVGTWVQLPKEVGRGHRNSWTWTQPT